MKEHTGISNPHSLAPLKVESIYLMDTEFLLHPYKLMYVPKYKAILVADLHLGKISHFRKNGIPIPIDAIDTNTLKLDHAIRQFNPEHLYFLGDLFHSDWNQEFEGFARWRAQYDAVFMHLVIGNHEILEREHYEAMGLSVYEEILLGPFLLSHQSVETTHYNLTGHLHPAIRLTGKALQSITLPCFYFEEKHGVLPAFGAFTGYKAIQPKRGSQVILIDKEKLIPIK